MPGVVEFRVTREVTLAAVEEIASQMLGDERIESAGRSGQRRLPVRIPVGG